MAPRYSIHQLRSIGERATSRSPPASAVQGMVLYELQKQNEMETLFHGDISNLGKTKTPSISLEERFVQLRSEVAALQKQALPSSSEDGVKAITVELHALRRKVHNHVARSDAHVVRLAAVEDGFRQMMSAKESQDTSDSLLEPMKQCCADDQLAAAGLCDVQAELRDIDADIQILFDERDAMVESLLRTTTRIDQAIKRVDDVIAGMDKQTLQRTTDSAHLLHDRIIQAECKAAEGCTDVLRQATALIAVAEQQAGGKAVEVESKVANVQTFCEQQVKAAKNDIERIVSLQVASTEQRARAEAVKLMDETHSRFSGMEDIFKQAGKRVHERLATLQSELGGRLGVSALDQLINERLSATQKQAGDLTVSLEQLRVEAAKNDNAARERDAHVHAQLEKLAGIVRALTGQLTHDSPSSAQLLPVQATGGQGVDLCIPKGKSLPRQSKEIIRRFTPSTQRR